jgi:hypothetical protein
MRRALSGNASFSSRPLTYRGISPQIFDHRPAQILISQQAAQQLPHYLNTWQAGPAELWRSLSTPLRKPCVQIRR